MQYKLKLTDEAGNTRDYTLTSSGFEEQGNLNDFILEALKVSEDKRELPFIIQSPNGTEVFPSVKMKFENFGSPLLGDKLEAMIVTWRC